MLPNDFPSVPAGDYDLDPAHIQPTDLEQFLLELINRARADRDAEHSRILTNLDDLSLFPNPDPLDYNIASGVSAAAKQPLAWNSPLADAADAHSQDMIDRDFFDHVNPDGVTALQRAIAAGYTPWTNFGENISAIFAGTWLPVDQARVQIHHANLWKSDGHQQGFMNPVFSEIGLGLKTGTYVFNGTSYDNTSMVTEKFGHAGKTFLTGVVLDDANVNNFYDVGEGQADVHVTVYNSTNTYVTSTSSSGGYSLEVPVGTYTVVFNDGDLGTAVVVDTVTIGTENVKIDVFENLIGAGDPVSLYTDDTFTTLVATYGSFAAALAAATAGQAIDIDDPATVGDVGAQTISVDNLTIRGDGPFDGDFTLGAAVNDFTLAGNNSADVTGNANLNSVTGSDGANVVSGLGGDDIFNLGDGSDDALGGGGNDLINGGLQGDTIQGGAGNDTVNGDDGQDSLLGGSAADTLNGGNGDDTLRGQNASDVLYGNDGNDDLYGEGFTDTLYGGNNDDALYGGGSADSLFGESGNDYLEGQNGADTLDGGSGADSLNGGARNDELHGGADNDTLLGSTGDDRLYGDGGSDVFQFRANHGTLDRIYDFEDGSDIIEFNIAGIDGISDLTLTNVFSGVDIDYGTGTVRVVGLSDTDFSSADFAFI